ncbi:MAG TPA: chromosome segregation protein SMC [Candidatus Baltobacteraceae bacterium]|nr:chromosome segregation protein SMC [Candidatus Baltobacteraceae bacterium]
MQLKKIKTFGFKTFAEPTTLEFGGGITAVVGPNGSGKSNLIDAFRWVLGEQSSKSLRSGKMEDVIFIGNEKRKPLGLAEVSITFDNSDGKLPVEYSEVEITRRAYRAGEIEYFINRNQCRLRDIMDLLMGTGLGPGSYSIVSQGQIDQILTSKPQDRRALFEETAGINKFLARKNESMRRLEQTEQNAIRINDLIAELERRIPELDTQVRRAKRFRKLTTRVRDLEILSYLRAGASRRAERETLKAELERNEEQRSAAAAQAATLGAQLAQARTNAYQQELEVEELRTRGQELRSQLARMEADYAAALARRETLEAQNTQTSEDAERVARERETLEASIASLQSQLEPLQAQLETARADELQAQTALAQARGQLDAIFTQLREVEADATQRAARKAERRAKGENARAEAERLEHESAAARARSEQLQIAAGAASHKFSERERSLAQLETQMLDAQGRSENAERAMAQAQSDLAHSQTAYREYSSEVAAAQSRLHTIEELENALEGHVPGTRAVVQAVERGELRGIEGIVSNLITTDEPYARAMDIAFGARLSNIITATSEDAERAIDYLNRKEMGRATFLPLDTLQNRPGRDLTPELRGTRGVIGYAHTLIRTEPQYEGIVRFLVGNVLVVDTLQTGIYLTRNRGFRDTIVTLSGEQIAGGGAITGGRYQREKSILSRRVQAQTLRDQLEQMQANLRQLEENVRAAAQASEHAAAQREEARASIARAELALAEVRSEMAAASADAERVQREFDAARNALGDLHAQVQAARERERELVDDLPDDANSDEQRAQLEADLAQARETIAAAESAQAQASGRAADLRERVAALGAERDGARARLGIIDQNTERAAAAREQMASEIAGLLDQTSRAGGEVEALRERVRTGDAQFEQARKAREALADEVVRLESGLRSAEIAEREAQSGGERHRTRLAEIEAELGMLVSQFAQNPATDDECRDVEDRYKEEPDTVTDDLPRLREELARLSNVNLNAEADRDELAQREAFLREQLDDLSKARETLLQSIREIEAQTQTKFNETFEQVAAAFTETYTRLFPGGTAKMWQTNPENLSETGIEISVQPPGKKLMPLPTLSGGERAMTAAALIFALIKVRPSPFYLLDEVDAALDDANVERFSSLVREMAGSSQMIIVTHNKQTMEMADRMYGVTMGEAGVSSIISAELTTKEREPEPALV